jgi:hypothetical protein
MSLSLVCDYPNCTNSKELDITKDIMEQVGDTPDIYVSIKGEDELALYEVCDKHIELFREYLKNYLDHDKEKSKEVKEVKKPEPKRQAKKPTQGKESKGTNKEVKKEIEDNGGLEALIQKQENGAKEMAEQTKKPLSAPKPLKKASERSKNTSTASNTTAELIEEKETIIEPSFASIVDLEATPAE